VTDSMDEPLDITPAVQQRLAWDIIPCDVISGMWSHLGLVPPSPEVAEDAHRESHNRVAQVAPLIPMTEIYITLAVDIISRMMIANLQQESPGDTLPDGLLQTLTLPVTEVVRGTVYPIMANLMEMGMLTLGPAAPPIVMETV